MRAKAEYKSRAPFHAGTILLVACRARKRAIKSFADRAKTNESVVLTDDAITAVVMPAAAAEAFINGAIPRSKTSSD